MDSDDPIVRGWGREPGGLPLDFAIIGAQKSGSTFLQRRLGQRPEITMLKRESSHFEDPDYARGGLRQLSGLLAPHTASVTGVKRPDYLPRAEVPPRVAEHTPRIRLLAVLREPVSRAVSAYFHLAAFGFVPVMDPSEALTGILDGRMQINHPKSQEILEYGRYATHLRRWHDWFAPEQFLLLLHEDVARDPVGSLAAALRFLDADEEADEEADAEADAAAGIDDVGSKVGSKANPGVYWPPRVRLRAARSRSYFDYDMAYGKISPKRTGPLGWSAVAALTAVDKLVLSRLGRDHRPSIDTVVEQRLHDYYACDVEDLATLLDRDLGAWRPRDR